MPPRHGKSELVSKWLPAWFLSVFPQRRVILSSYEATFARSWGRKARQCFIDASALTGQLVSDEQTAAADWETTQGGGMVTAGVGGPITGRGADLLIIDDPIKNAEEALSETIRNAHWDWWQSTASTRIEPGGCAIVIATRWHPEDLTGRMLLSAEQGDMQVRRLRLPALAEPGDPLGRDEGEALWPARWPTAKLLERQRATDAYWWQALYQQSPRRDGRTAWPDAYFEQIWARRWPDRFDLAAMALDPSTGRDTKRGDYSAIVFVGLSGGKLWVRADLDRRPPEASVAAAIEMAGRLSPDGVAVESNQFQSLLGAEFDRQCGSIRVAPLPLYLIPNMVAKEIRIGRIGPHLEQRHIQIRDDPGGRLLVSQLRDWPLAQHDDGPDALEMALRLLAEMQGSRLRNSHETMEIALA